MGAVSFDERRARHLLWVAGAMIGLGIYAFVLRGADQPADPSIQPAGATTVPVVTPPGDPARVPLEGFDEVADRGRSGR